MSPVRAEGQLPKELIEMTYIKGVFCDTCKTLVSTDDPKANAGLIRDDLAKRHGWWHSRITGKDLCPICAKGGDLDLPPGEQD